MNGFARIALVLLCMAAASPAWAQSTRTWVSGVGDDANSCSRTAPCKTLAGAISKTAAGGEINAIDAGGFGAVTITKSITIDLHNVLGSVLVSGTNGIIVNVAATDVVTLRGIDIIGVTAGSSSALSGVRFIGGGTLRVEDSNITGFGNHGIDIEPTVTTATSKVFVKNTTIGDNKTTDIFVNPGTGANVNVTVEKSSLIHTPIGIEAKSTSRVTVHDTVINGHATNGIHAQDTAEVNVEGGIISNNGVGIQGDSTVRISEVMLSNNTTGLAGTVVSYGNNRVSAGNGTNGTPSSTLSQE